MRNWVMANSKIENKIKLKSGINQWDTGSGNISSMELGQVCSYDGPVV